MLSYDFEKLHKATFATYLLLLLLLVLSPFIDGPEGLAAKLVLVLIYCSGLLLVLYGLIKKQRRSYIWLCFILLFYFVALVQSLYMPGSDLQQLTKGILLFLVVTCFVISMLAGRTFKVASS